MTNIEDCVTKITEPKVAIDTFHFRW